MFSQQLDPNHNWLPKDGIVNYHGCIMEQESADEYFKNLLKTIPWENDVLNMFGKRIVTNRKVAWYGDRPYAYTYSNSTKSAFPWTKDLRELKQLVEKVTNEKYNSCLLNLYHSGEEGMSWHSDDEKELKKHGAIASLSFGAVRKFVFKHKETKEKVELTLDHGSLVVMKGEVQDYWLHQLPKSKKVKAPRVNLTFRAMVQ